MHVPFFSPLPSHTFINCLLQQDTSFGGGQESQLPFPQSSGTGVRRKKIKAKRRQSTTPSASHVEQQPSSASSQGSLFSGVNLVAGHQGMATPQANNQSFYGNETFMGQTGYTNESTGSFLGKSMHNSQETPGFLSQSMLSNNKSSYNLGSSENQSALGGSEKRQLFQENKASSSTHKEASKNGPTNSIVQSTSKPGQGDSGSLTREQYYNEFAKLNRSMEKWVTTKLQEYPVSDWTPAFKDYIEYAEKLHERYKRSTLGGNLIKNAEDMQGMYAQSEQPTNSSLDNSARSSIFGHNDSVLQSTAKETSQDASNMKSQRNEFESVAKKISTTPHHLAPQPYSSGGSFKNLSGAGFGNGPASQTTLDSRTHTGLQSSMGSESARPMKYDKSLGSHFPSQSSAEPKSATNNLFGQSAGMQNLGENNTSGSVKSDNIFGSDFVGQSSGQTNTETSKLLGMQSSSETSSKATSSSKPPGSGFGLHSSSILQDSATSVPPASLGMPTAMSSSLAQHNASSQASSDDRGTSSTSLFPQSAFGSNPFQQDNAARTSAISKSESGPSNTLFTESMRKPQDTSNLFSKSDSQPSSNLFAGLAQKPENASNPFSKAENQSSNNLFSGDTSQSLDKTDNASNLFGLSSKSTSNSSSLFPGTSERGSGAETQTSLFGNIGAAQSASTDASSSFPGEPSSNLFAGSVTSQSNSLSGSDSSSLFTKPVDSQSSNLFGGISSSSSNMLFGGVGSSSQTSAFGSAGMFTNSSSFGSKQASFGGFGSTAQTVQPAPAIATESQNTSTGGLFGNIGTERNESNQEDSKENTSGTGNEEEEDFKPIDVCLEGDKILLECRSKVYRLSVDADKNSSWKDLGVGTLVLIQGNASSSRVCFKQRYGSTERLLVNGSLYSKKPAQGKQIALTLMESSKGSPTTNTYLVKVKTEEMAKDVDSKLQTPST